MNAGSERMKSLCLGLNDTVLPQVLDVELKDLSSPVNQELDSVKWIVANQPQEVPEQLLKALEKDAKNLQKSFSSVSDALEAWLLNLRSAAETEKVQLTNRLLSSLCCFSRILRDLCIHSFVSCLVLISVLFILRLKS